MIISASYKTDIPTFYGEWFINRLRAGFCRMLNPYSKSPILVSLKKEDVDGFIFWTKNITPFTRYLPEINERGYPFVIQHTINGYPRSLETSVADPQRTVQSIRSVSEKYGPRTVVWRYDTIIFSSLTPQEFHVENFRRIAIQLQGMTDEVVISFAHLYQKTKRNVELAAEANNFDWWDPSPEDKRALARALLEIATANGMTLSVCSQRAYLVDGAADAKCVDARRLEDVAQRSVKARLKGNRQECGCFESRDIGDYNTCPHGCVYCYAVQSRETALSRYRQHDPLSEFLFSPPGLSQLPPPKPQVQPSRQISLFGDATSDPPPSDKEE
ncbi:DUF1848 domain-containing protein [Corallococcus exiguus]|uniref:DUF1848 domain-containing protein n=1 Tax=Corallococcus exiguus TaxID=83462 RepID=UPI003DA488F8